ncbi:MAG: Ribose-phosphate pyrophosphokinase [Chlamydiia bacterium]|nr:Ribose-phosphate pyrophosphokinase [Chlamydiia bacterium]MCH9615125.1 Ribose-phosphate pyrophosphokinase [Chlamydiia bacterium]MCH9628553.1 Ribose-phosphate pyrophosphokinase [Chlamydiia bacterium]
MIDNNTLIFSGSSHKQLSEDIAKELGANLGKLDIQTFPDGEIGVQLCENVRGRDIFVIQSIARHPNLYLMELLIIVDALKRSSAGSISVVLPYYGYCRQDRKDKGRVPITAKLVADMLETAGVDRVVTMDLHASQVQGFFDIPVDNLYARPILVDAAKRLLEHPVVVTPDVGSIRLANIMAHALETEFAIVDKRRINSDKVESGALIGSVKDRDVLLVDDMVSTGSTLKAAANVCREAGAKRIYAAVTHGLLLGDIFSDSAIERLIITDTISLPSDVNREKVEILRAAPLFAKAIESIGDNSSISSLFK